MTLRAALAIAGMSALIAIPDMASAQNNSVQVGRLRCSVSAGLGLVIMSSKEMSCIFRAANGTKERYFGTIKKFGLNIGVTGRGVLGWTVIAPTIGLPAGALAGDYVGVAASASAAVGVGANALVGGSGRSITLQPLSVQAQTGLSLAAGVASLTLRPGT